MTQNCKKFFVDDPLMIISLNLILSIFSLIFVIAKFEHYIGFSLNPSESDVAFTFALHNINESVISTSRCLS